MTGPRPHADPPTLVAGESGLVAETLGKSFGKRPALRGVSVALRRGEAVGLLGPNGAGKTTCFYLMTGLMAADYGRVRLDGQDVTRLPMYRRARLGLGYLPQEASIFRGLTVENNINEMIKLAAVCQFVALWERVVERTGCGPLSVIAVDRVNTRVLAHQHPLFSQHLHG